MRTIFSLLSALIVALLVCGLAVRAQSGSTITIGETNVLSSADSGNGNLLLAQNATLSTSGTVESLSFYVTQASGNLILGIYDASGPNGGPGALKAQTNSFTPVTGWNTASVISPVSLTAGTYWLAYLPSSNNLAFVTGQTGGSALYYSYPFGAMPAQFSTSPNSVTPLYQWSLYATLNTAPQISSVSLSNGSFTAGVPSGTVVGTISVAMSSGSFTGSLSLSGTNASDFKIVGSNLETNGVLPAGSYKINIVATESGVSNSPVTLAKTITGVSPLISSISLSQSSFVGGSPSATLVGAINVAMSPSSPAFSGSLSLSTTQGGCTATNGANNSSFAISGNNLVTNGTVAPGTYAICILATEASASNSPVGQAETLTGSSTIVTIGETRVLSTTVSGDANLLFAQSTTLPQTATLQSLSFYVSTAAGNLILGVYDATGPNGGPGKLLAQTNSFPVAVGWNTANVVTPVSLAAGTYWLAWLSDNNSMVSVGTTTGTEAYYSFTFGSLPTSFSTTPTTDTAHRSLHANLSTRPASITSVAIFCGSSCSAPYQTSGAAVGTLSTTLTNGTFSGTYSLATSGTVNGVCTATTGANNASFTISGARLTTAAALGSGTYKICIAATQSGLANSPYGLALQVTVAQQSIASISLSNTSFAGGSPSGTVVGAINVAMSPSSPAYSGSLSLSTTQGGCTATNGANNSSFVISGNNVVTNGIVAPGTYAICILATEASASNSPVGQAFTFTGALTNTPLEEFIGPLLGWRRAHADYGCDNTGATDATACLQGALNGIASSSPVLYLEPGTYKISATLNVVQSGSTGNAGANIIGADPATTTVSWAGGAGGTMMTLGLSTSGGAAAFKVSRITFNGNNLVGMILDESYGCSGLSGCIFDTTNEYSDLVLENARIGLRCGANGLGCASVDLIRDKFQNLTSYGVAPGNWNALDVDAYYSQFINTHVGISTGGSGGAGPGSVNAYGSLFQNNSVADVVEWSPTLQALQGNFSTGSNQFVTNGGTLNNTAFGSAFANTAVGLTGTGAPPVDFNEGGWPFIGNTIQSPVGASAPVVRVEDSTGDLLSGGNTFTLGSPSATCTGSAPAAANRCHEITTGSFPDQVVSRGSVNTTPPTMPSTPPNNGPGGNNKRQIYEVGNCAAFEGANCHSNASIGAAVTAAINGGSARPVVHIPAGNYGGTSVTIPACPNAGCDIQIIGDGFYTSVSGTGASVFQLTGPSTAVIRDMYLAGGGSTDAVLITSADQAGARVFMQQPWVNNNGSGNVNTGIYLDSLVNTTVEVHDFMPGGTNGNGNGAKVTGGTLNVFGGSGTASWNQLTISGSPTVYWLGVWNDNNGGGTNSGECSLLNATGSGTITYAATMSAMGAANGGCSLQAFNFNNFTGNAFIAGSAMDVCASGCSVAITGNSTGSNILIDGNLGPPNSSNWVNDTSSGSHTINFLNNTECSGSVGSCNSFPQAPEFCVPSSPCPNINTINATLGQAMNTRMVYPTAVPAGITNVQLYRLFLQGANNGIHIQH